MPDRHDNPAEKLRLKQRASMQSNARQERRKQERDIPLYWEPREVGSRLIQKVVNAYNHDVPIISILRKVQQDRIKQGRRPLILADIYTILVAAEKDGRIKQRKLAASKELQVKKFAMMMKAWKQGELTRNCIKVIEPVPSIQFVETLLRGVNRRVADRKAELKNSPKVDTSTPQAISAMEVLLRAVVKTMPDSRKAIVIYLNELEPHQLLFLRRVPSLESDMALEHKIRDPSDETLLPDEVVMSSIREMTRTNDKKTPAPREPEIPEIAPGDSLSSGNPLPIDSVPDVVNEEDDDDMDEELDEEELDDEEWDDDEEDDTWDKDDEEENDLDDDDNDEDDEDWEDEDEDEEDDDDLDDELDDDEEAGE